MIADLRDLGVRIDGLLSDYRLPDGLGYRVVRNFASEFPGAPVGLMFEREDITLELFARSKGILLLRKPLALPALTPWLSQLKISA